MKKLGIIIALALAGATAASAQSFNVGPRGIGVDVDGPDRRLESRERRRTDDREERVLSRREREVRATGGVGCRTTIVRRENRFGKMTSERIRECD